MSGFAERTKVKRLPTTVLTSSEDADRPSYHYAGEIRPFRSPFEVASSKRGGNNPIFWVGTVAIMGQKIKNPSELLKDCFSALE